MSMKSNVVDYPEFSLCYIYGDSAEEISEADDRLFYRVELPHNPNNSHVMAKTGYLFVERTIGVSINLKKNNIDYSKLVRFDVKPADKSDKAVLEIALGSFPSDRRFHVRPKPDDKIAGTIISNWVDNLSEVYVCFHNDQIVGFLDLEPYGEKDCFIHLVAVKERYRATGVAVSLYAFAIQKAKEKGCDKIYGRISSGNTAVMNLYARLGGIFADPTDVFVRKEI